MKLIIVLAIVSILSADEINRIDSIVHDISNLREKYNSCQRELDSSKLQNITPKLEVQREKISTCQKEKTELKNYKELLKKEQEKNKELAKKIDSSSNENSNNKEINKEIRELEKEIENKNKLLKSKENEIISLKKNIKQIKEKNIYSLKNAKNDISPKENGVLNVCKDENRFPKLMMKEKSNNIYRIKPTTFRLKENSGIYSSMDGKKVYEWEKNTSFTSNIRSDEWIKITGYFVNRIWQHSSEELWVKNLNVVQK
jgi:predicted RNase H-like nuclease (RuvC/YqgF family)